MSEPRTKPTGASVEDFLNAVEAPGRREDGFAMLALLGEVTGKPAEMWGPSIVGFDRYPMKYANGTTQQWPMIGFSPRKAELVLYFTGAVKERSDLLAKLGSTASAGAASTSSACRTWIPRCSASWPPGATPRSRSAIIPAEAAVSRTAARDSHCDRTMKCQSVTYQSRQRVH